MWRRITEDQKFECKLDDNNLEIDLEKVGDSREYRDKSNIVVSKKLYYKIIKINQKISKNKSVPLTEVVKANRYDKTALTIWSDSKTSEIEKLKPGDVISIVDVKIGDCPNLTSFVKNFTYERNSTILRKVTNSRILEKIKNVNDGYKSFSGYIIGTEDQRCYDSCKMCRSKL